MAKHYDNKNNLINQLKRSHAEARIAAASGWSAYMMMGMYVLRTEYGFGEKRMTDFVNHMLELNTRFENDEFTIEDLQKKLWDEVGIIIEMPK